MTTYEDLISGGTFTFEGIEWNGRNFSTSARILFVTEEAANSYDSLPSLLGGVDAILGGRYRIFTDTTSLVPDAEVDRLIAAEKVADQILAGEATAPATPVEPMRFIDAYRQVPRIEKGVETWVDFIGRTFERSFWPETEELELNESDRFSVGGKGHRFDTGKVVFGEFRLV